jgi:hypothetical protein
MGIGLFSHWSCDSFESKPASTPQWLPNPDAKNFHIHSAIQREKYLIADVNYPNCINFEGHKVMVYRSVTLKELQNRTEIDPHFKDGDKFSPIARFIPTNEGWLMALDFVDSQLKSENIQSLKKDKIIYGDLIGKKGKWKL